MEQDSETRKTEFAVFCIENTAERLKCDGQDVIDALNKTKGIENFIYPSFEALHTQSKEYIVDEIITYLKEHNQKIVVK
jgi:hypothetical protein